MHIQLKIFLHAFFCKNCTSHDFCSFLSSSCWGEDNNICLMTPMMPEQRKFISEKLYSGKLKLMSFWYTFVDNLVWLSIMLTWEKSNGFAHKVSKQNHLMNILNFLWLFAFNILILSISGHQHCYNILSILILINACHYCNKIACNQYLLKISHGSFHTYAPLVIIQWWWSTSLFTLHLKSVITHHQELFF